MQDEMPKAFEPSTVEARWYAFWVENGFFAASLDPADGRPAYVVPMPPPNVTGSLHVGHAMRVTFEDALVRWHRMRGFNALWQPGIDHAGIATQTVVERLLKREGKSRHDLGREAFAERVWQWKAESGGRIALQQRELGASADWGRSKFTMDEDLSRAVREAFVRLYEEGLLYRDKRLVNWDVEAQTVLSDLEVENDEGAQGELFEFAYRVEGSGEELVVATTRPETMLGDTAVAVHPDDPRYAHLVGRKLVHPFADRRVPVVADAVLVDPTFGTGAVKVTPAHDFNDFATGKRHGLEFVTVIGFDGKMNELAGPFQGMDRFEARKAVKKKLAELGLAKGAKPHTLTLPRSERNGSIVEPMLSTQWFVSMKGMADRALAAVAEGRTKIVPGDWVKTYDHFLENIQDWCVSRQLWWGHQVPAFYCDACGEVTVARHDPAECPKCRAPSPRRDPDVLDTWFSSALWPFSTLGWPDRTPALARFYPAADLETGYDILFFWVARMMMFGLHFLGEVPFRRVLLAGMVVDETGQKMSKVKGNVIDPLDLIHGASFREVVEKASPGVPFDEALKKFQKAYPSTAQLKAKASPEAECFPPFGADALRLTLASYSPATRRIPLAPKRVEGYRHFCNKLWNATRYVLPHLAGLAPAEGVPPATSLANRWVLDRLASALGEAFRALDDYRLDEALSALYHFVWHDFCDWYLELTKPVFQQGSEAEKAETRAVLAHALEASLRALHPFAPFVTEDLWQRLPKPASRPASVCVAPYPAEAEGRNDPEAARQMEALQRVIGAARAVRSEHEVHPGAPVPLVLRTNDEGLRALLGRESVAVRTLVKTHEAVAIEAAGGARPRGHVLAVAGDVEVLVGLVGLVEGSKELDRIEREKKKVEKDLAALEKRLAQPSFVEKAPAEVVAEARTQLEALVRTRARLDEARALAAELDAPAG
ncbi:MAG TPA: valine--tRNA ligase [Polyangiaceae bacterium]|nr:valine--tRNA ligase [Polyangiaceae bacterium]